MDVGLNDSHTVYKNIYQNFLITAAKMHYYIEGWGIDMSRNMAFILSMLLVLAADGRILMTMVVRAAADTIHQVIRYSHAIILRKSSNKVSKASGGMCNVQRTHVTWLVGKEVPLLYD